MNPLNEKGVNEDTRICPVCHMNKKLTTIECCAKCTCALRHSDADLEKDNIICSLVEPIIPTAVLDECSVAIAKSKESDVSCFFSKKKSSQAKYYSSMNDWLDLMEHLDKTAEEEGLPVDETEASLCVRMSAYVSFFVNFLLLIAKAIALSSSISYTLISSLADSALDLIAGIILGVAAANSKFTRDDLIKYPAGKSRVSVVGILVFSVLMSCCTLYIIVQCIISLATADKTESNSTVALISMGITVGVKLSMWIVYRLLKHPICDTLADDHRNDVFTNALGLFMYWGTEHIGWWMDSTGGILLSLFVLYNWCVNAYENARMLLGKSAPPEVIRSLTYVASNHHPLVRQIEQVIAFQVGPMYFAELHIVVPGNLPLEVAHWIGESLQLKLERIPQMERAYVHVDCESHDENEHLLFMKVKGKYNEDESLL